MRTGGSTAKANWFGFPVKHATFQLKKKIGLPSCTRTLAYSLSLQKQGRFPLGLGGLFIAGNAQMNPRSMVRTRRCWSWVMGSCVS